MRSEPEGEVVATDDDMPPSPMVVDVSRLPSAYEWLGAIAAAGCERTVTHRKSVHALV